MAGVSLNSKAINLLHHIRLLCSRGHLQEALKLFTPSLPVDGKIPCNSNHQQNLDQRVTEDPHPHLHSSIPITHTPHSSTRAPAAVLSPNAKLSTATCFYTTLNLISTTS
ncbi:hypothetical protein AAG906_038953 [Vitis piasezkii]